MSKGSNTSCSARWLASELSFYSGLVLGIHASRRSQKSACRSMLVDRLLLLLQVSERACCLELQQSSRIIMARRELRRPRVTGAPCRNARCADRSDRARGPSSVDGPCPRPRQPDVCVCVYDSAQSKWPPSLVAHISGGATIAAISALGGGLVEASDERRQHCEARASKNRSVAA